jgi:pyruvate carboxylase
VRQRSANHEILWLLASLGQGYRAKLSDAARVNCDLCGPFVQTRALYAPFESDLRSSSSDVYYHEMPGGQYTNLKFQVTALSVLNGLACATEAGRCVCCVLVALCI